MARTVYHLVHKNADDRWHLESGGKDADSFATKEEALEAGKKLCNDLNDTGTLSQLVVHRQDGSIETEFTYGADPRRTAG
jgi:hypothetical protein